jgi:hypothetical protein
LEPRLNEKPSVTIHLDFGKAIDQDKCKVQQ